MWKSAYVGVYQLLKNSVVRNLQPTGVSTTRAYLFSFVHVSPRLPFWGPEFICIHFLPHVHRTETTWAWQVYYRKQCFSFEWLSHMQERGEVSEQLSQEVMPDNEHTGLFISPSGTSELDCATTKKDTAERSISIGRESLKVFFCTRGLGVLAGSTARG